MSKQVVLLILAAILFLLAAAGYVAVQRREATPPLRADALATYLSEQHRVQFQYPTDYFERIVDVPQLPDRLAERLFAARAASGLNLQVDFVAEPTHRDADVVTTRVVVGGREASQDVQSYTNTRIPVPGAYCSQRNFTVPYKGGELLIDFEKCEVPDEGFDPETETLFTADENYVMQQIISSVQFI